MVVAMSKQCIEVSLSELMSRIGSMTDAELIKYSELHVSLDSGVLVEELVKRLRSTKRELFMCVTNQNEGDYNE